MAVPILFNNILHISISEDRSRRGGACPSGLRKHATEVYSVFSARSYSDAAHVSTSIVSYKTAAPKRQFCGTASNVKALQEKGLQEMTV